MLRRLLIPLDGSPTSAWVLSRARNLIEQPGLETTLVRVVEASEEDSEDSGFRSDPRHQTARFELSVPLDELRRRGLRVQGKVLFGDPSAEILREADAAAYDMIAMTTHGRTGMARVLSGSVALRVVEKSPIPVLLFRPTVGDDGTLSPLEKSTAAQFRRILVPLDGTHESEEMIPQAVELAARFRAMVILFSSVPAGNGAAGHVQHMNQYLVPRAAPFENEGLKVKIVVRVGAAVEEALAVIEEMEVDALVMATHANKGIDSIFHRSVTERLLTRGSVPLLVMRNKRNRGAPLAAAPSRHVTVD